MPITAHGPDSELRLKVTPRGGRDALAGLVVDAAGVCHLALRVAAPAEGGKANAAVLRLLARSLHIAPGSITLLTGATGRHKRVLVPMAPEALRARLSGLVPDGGRRGSPAVPGATTRGGREG